MRIGILGVGNIGATLTQRLSAAGHDVKVANSRGPETIPDAVFSSGGRAVHAHETGADVDALIISVPFAKTPDIRPVVDQLPAGAVLLDTSNYYPQRDGHIGEVDDGQVESRWVQEQLGGRPLVKAWNAITTGSFTRYASAPGSVGRIAVPVAADSDADRSVGMSLVEQTGFDGFDAGTLDQSWRQQPGAPSYCTDLTRDELATALDAADPARSPRRRDLLLKVITELMQDVDPGRRAESRADVIVELNRLIYGS
ncbi:NADPH-dependent F420 reductase [Rhodococcus opacus]|uniref:NADPH-dependent F420 reductase n=1 Tax=Rhodococcus opacus TaxID=37919 RepID=UPI002475C32E|nr:NAD(P)-binding domain-containing protein [Rhodococcus opacus]MDH6291322.1 putative dinucleotide-binding enzyme [Rhodococcus opacus]